MNMYNKTKVDNKTIEYLEYHPDLYWVSANMTTLPTISNAVKWQSGNYTMMIGRLTAENVSGIVRKTLEN